MPAHRISAAVIAVVTLLAACGDDDTASGNTTAATTTTTAATTTTTTTTTAATAATTTTPAGLEQPAIWPAAGVVFDTPEEAAADFVREVLGVPPSLGEFQQGDSRSGEIEVFSPGEGGTGTQIVRGLLFLRQLGPDDGWFILAAGNDNASITAPEAMDEVVAGPLVVEGQARGFEGNVAVSAFVAGDAGAEIDQVLTQAGAFETPEPFTVSLDLSSRSPGDTVVLLVRGGVGLETDPGEFGAIPVVIAA